MGIITAETSRVWPHILKSARWQSVKTQIKQVSSFKQVPTHSSPLSKAIGKSNHAPFIILVQLSNLTGLKFIKKSHVWLHLQCGKKKNSNDQHSNNGQKGILRKEREKIHRKFRTSLVNFFFFFFNFKHHTNERLSFRDNVSKCQLTSG